jgi:hypothetical protein
VEHAKTVTKSNFIFFVRSTTQVSISPTFYEQHFCAKVFWTALS